MSASFPAATMAKNDRKAYWIIGIFTVVVIILVSALGQIKLEPPQGWNMHFLAAMNAFINGFVAVLLIAALWSVKQGYFKLHKQIMMLALVLSVVFLLSYTIHKLYSGEARFGDANFDGVVDNAEKLAVGGRRTFYLIMLSTHILLAGIILPFILFTAYRALTGDYHMHKKLARITWPLWFYVSVTGPLVWWFIKPYYS